MRKTITTVAIAAMVLTATAALAGPTPEQKCQAAKNSAAGKYAACLQSAEKSLALTGDATKYAASIAKCETNFANAWQKAIDSATSAGATCPDAPLAAGDYKPVIDAHSGNIATALGQFRCVRMDRIANHPPSRPAIYPEVEQAVSPFGSQQSRHLGGHVSVRLQCHLRRPLQGRTAGRKAALSEWRLQA